jgi:hypothetical protein
LLGLFVLSAVLGAFGGQRPKQTRLLAERLAREGDVATTLYGKSPMRLACSEPSTPTTIVALIAAFIVLSFLDWVRYPRLGLPISSEDCAATRRLVSVDGNGWCEAGDPLFELVDDPESIHGGDLNDSAFAQLEHERELSVDALLGRPRETQSREVLVSDRSRRTEPVVARAFESEAARGKLNLARVDRSFSLPPEHCIASCHDSILARPAA